MSEAAERISLTSALTLAAFGVEVSGERFAQELNTKHFGLTREEAFSQLTGALDALLQKADSGSLVLHGRFSREANADGTEEIARIPPDSALSHKAFDYRIDGLRLGDTALLWFSSSEDPYRQPSFARPDHYCGITAVRGQVRKFLGTGSSPYRQETKKNPLPEADLKAWWDGLSTEQRKMPRKKLWELAKKSYPKHNVTRVRVRSLGGPRKPGRPKLAKK
jgi:hypothetical protein